jgi:four helix bundle protein
MDLVEAVYGLTQASPRQEIYGLASQLQRAAVSIPSNLAEGHTREHTREYYHHVSIARASLAEVETQCEIANRLGYLGAKDLQRVLQESASLGRQLTSLRDSLARRLDAAPRPEPQAPAEKV